jgi:aminoglycoside phosphotransferase (APT) family kinase protein
MVSDPQFPQLHAALDSPRMQGLLQSALLGPLDNHGQGLVVETCLVEEKRYEPGKSCVLSYRLQLHDVRTGNSREQLVAARLYKAEKGLEEVSRARSQPLYLTPGLKPLAYLPAAGMVVWSFPNDRKLSHLPQLLDVEFLASHLPPKLGKLGVDESSEIASVRTELLHYLPERSCMIRYHVTVTRRSTGERCAVTLYGKTYRDDSGAEVYSIMRQLAEQMPGSAVPLGYDQELRVLWQSHVPGEPFLWETLPASHAPDVFREIARCVAKFHRCTVHARRRFDLDDIDRSLLDTVEVAERACPDLAGRIKSVVSTVRAERRSIDWSDSLETPIHRDLKMRNFLIDGGGVGLIDMDCVCIGDPLSDVGSLIANFYMNGIRARCGTGSIRNNVEVFCRAYAESVPWTISRPRINWYTATAFLHEITRRSIRQLDAERVKHISDYLDLSEYFSGN